jgi:phytanoyl-CoA hydroxylase
VLISSTHAAAYDRDGYVVVRKFLSDIELDELRRELDRFVREVAPSLPPTQAFYQRTLDGGRALKQIHRMNCDPWFESYRAHPRWNALAEAVVGEPCTASPPMWLNKPPNTNYPTPPHQDNYAFCLVPPRATMIFLATEPIDDENGSLRYAPGSHRRGMRPHTNSGVPGFSQRIVDYGPEDEAREVAVALDSGDAVCHHPETVHRAASNRSAYRSRVALAMTFTGVSARVDPQAMAAYERLARHTLIIDSCDCGIGDCS